MFAVYAIISDTVRFSTGDGTKREYRQIKADIIYKFYKSATQYLIVGTTSKNIFKQTENYILSTCQSPTMFKNMLCFCNII